MKFVFDISERQIEEKRIKKLQEKASSGAVVGGTWADHFSNYKPMPVPDQAAASPRVTSDDMATVARTANPDIEVRTSSAPAPGETE